MHEVNSTVKITLTSGFILDGIITEDKNYSGTVLIAAGNVVTTFSFSYVGGE